MMPDEPALAALTDEICNRHEERAVLDAPAFWERMGMANAFPADRQAFGKLLRARRLSLTEDHCRHAVYLVWMGRPSPEVEKAKQVETQAAAARGEGEWAERLAPLSTLQPLDLTAHSLCPAATLAGAFDALTAIGDDFLPEGRQQHKAQVREA